MTQKSLLKMVWKLGTAIGNCPHKGTNIAPDVPLSAYEPLSRGDIANLLTIAKTFAKNAQIVTGAQARLIRGIPGMACPHQDKGPVAEKSVELSEFFMDHYREGPTKANVNRIFKLTR